MEHQQAGRGVNARTNGRTNEMPNWDITWRSREACACVLHILSYGITFATLFQSFTACIEVGTMSCSSMRSRQCETYVVLFFGVITEPRGVRRGGASSEESKKCCDDLHFMRAAMRSGRSLA
ncbi:hypothetical protein CC86DRAFT_7687 [Ophiobolus disseminans]|uniref:Uncharacterized protein n=1 Tax=Ophiobolus disseminans TaxID=1469910 RepID=A0A6A7AJ87_9PLEO|nr:hypothetical protein CC86DRAFT_7687 [Ophiobolus disseminans]